MKRLLSVIGSGLLLVASLVAAGTLNQTYITHAANTLPGSNEVIAIGGTTDGLAVNAPIDIWAYSGDGNTLVFTSGATNLPNAGGYSALYAYNIKTNTTSRLDMSTNGTIANSSSSDGYKISETGRYVTFMSGATNLIDGSTMSVDMTYKRDLQTGTTTYLGGGYSGGLSQNRDINLAISNDGRFSLMASRYISNTYPNAYGISYRDTLAGGGGATYLGNLNYQGVDDMKTGGMSCDGSFVVYQKYRKIYLADLRKGNTITTLIGNDTSASPFISCNGRYVLYVTQNRTDISPTPVGLNSSLHLVMYDRITGERNYVDSNSAGTFSNGYGSYYHDGYSGIPNYAKVSVADTGDIVFSYNDNSYLKHLSDGSGTLEPIAKTATGTYINVSNGRITSNGEYTFFTADPYSLGLAPSPSTPQTIRAKTGL